MDELKLKLSTKFMRGFVAKQIKKAIFKQTGYQVDIQLNEIAVETKDGRIYIHANVDASLDSEDFVDIIKSTDVD